jgi:hypothetical protein
MSRPFAIVAAEGLLPARGGTVITPSELSPTGSSSTTRAPELQPASEQARTPTPKKAEFRIFPLQIVEPRSLGPGRLLGVAMAGEIRPCGPLFSFDFPERHT